MLLFVGDDSGHRSVEVGDGIDDIEIANYEKQGLKIHVGSDLEFDS
jgi:hypothetical protein